MKTTAGFSALLVPGWAIRSSAYIHHAIYPAMWSSCMHAVYLHMHTRACVLLTRTMIWWTQASSSSLWTYTHARIDHAPAACKLILPSYWCELTIWMHAYFWHAAISGMGVPLLCPRANIPMESEGSSRLSSQVEWGAYLLKAESNWLKTFSKGPQRPRVQGEWKSCL